MRIEYDAFTADKLRHSLKDSNGYIKLVNETEGCSANGVYSLHLLNEPKPMDVPFESGEFHFVVDRQEQILFDDVMRLKADPVSNAYRLSSDSMLYSSNVKLKDKRNA